MPHLVQMDKKYSKKGMVLIGAEVQGSVEDKINEIIDEHKVQFTVTKGVSGPNLSNAIPHMAVFSTKGDLVFNGHPNNAEKAIKTALKMLKRNLRVMNHHFSLSPSISLMKEHGQILRVKS